MKIRLLPILALAAISCGCGAKVKAGETIPPALAVLAIAPDNIKANYWDDVVVTGQGFTPDAVITLDTWTLDQLDITASIDSPTKITLSVSGMTELPTGSHLLRVAAGGATAEIGLHVRPLMVDFQHVRTLPGVFLRNGGFMDMWVQLHDSNGDFIGPDHELAGLTGLTSGNFYFDGVYATRLGEEFDPTIAGIASVEFEPVGEAQPIAVSITIDQSGSMIGLGVNPIPSDPDDERISQSEAFVNRLGANDEAEIVSFHGNAGAVQLVADWTPSKPDLLAGLETLRTGETGNTPLYDAMLSSLNDMQYVEDGYTKAVVVLTDGRDTTSTTTADEVISLARDLEVPVFTIGLGNPGDAASLDRTTLQQIADQTGGRVFFAEDPTALAGIFDYLSSLLTDSYKLSGAISFDPPLTDVGSYEIDGDLAADLDGEELYVTFPAFNVSVLN